MKRIEINYCNDCPYCGRQYPGYICVKALLRVISSKFEENCITIPDWCPLPDVEEKNENPLLKILSTKEYGYDGVWLSKEDLDKCLE